MKLGSTEVVNFKLSLACSPWVPPSKAHTLQVPLLGRLAEVEGQVWHGQMTSTFEKQETQSRTNIPKLPGLCVISQNHFLWCYSQRDPQSHPSLGPAGGILAVTGCEACIYWMPGLSFELEPPPSSSFHISASLDVLWHVRLKLPLKCWKYLSQ